MFRKVMIANRGEVALRVIRTLRDMGIRSVAVYSDADRDALFVNEADEAYRLGAAPASASYLNIDALLDVAGRSGAEAVHPGYGFLSENAPFAAAVREAGLVFIGPSVQAIREMGDKVEARRLARELDVPVVPGTPGPVTSLEEALAFGAEAGYPVAVKAAGGGGGRGIRVVRSRQEMEEALAAATREAEAYFKNPEIYLERYFDDPKHVEVQVLGDQNGHLVALGERDCSVQRRHQKLIEESPSPSVDRDLRARFSELALRVASSVRYSSAGTVEFLLTQGEEIYFLEMNTRIQVEHPVTEQVTGVDLVKEMILGSAGEDITVEDTFLDLYGHAIEVRINAENPLAGFRPTPGPLQTWIEPGGIGVRLDSGVYTGFTIPDAYDSLIAKLITWGPDREVARRRGLRALEDFRVVGPSTTIPFARAVMSSDAFIKGTLGTQYVGENLDGLTEVVRSLSVLPPPPSAGLGVGRGDERVFDVEVNSKRFNVVVAEIRREEETRTERKRARPRQVDAAGGGTVLSPMHGTVVSLKKKVGDTVEAGETLLVIEAMKMENEVNASRGGTVTAIDVSVGETVEADQRLAVVE